MNFDHLLQRLIRMITRSAINAGAKTANDHLRRSGKDGGPPTAAERKETRAADDLAKKAKQLQKITRRLR